MTEVARLPARPPPAGMPLWAWIRCRVLAFHAAEARRNPIKLVVVAAAWATLLGGCYALAVTGIRFLYQAAGVGPFLLDRLWYLLLFIIAVMLAASQLAGGYSTLIRSPETHWWMGLPMSARTISRAKWLESSGYSSWAVLLLALPLGLAHVVVAGRSLWLVGWLLLVLIPLVAIVTSLATAVLLVWLRWCGRLALRREALAVGLVASAGAVFWMLGERYEGEPNDVWFMALQELLPRIQIAMAPWLPSRWAANAFGAGMNGRWVEGLLYAGLLSTTALVCWRWLDHLSSGLLLRVVRDAGFGETVARPATTGSVPLRSVWWMRRPLTCALAKDVMLVARDPMQWTQAVVFFGLLGAYFANIHRLAQASVQPSWRLGVASLNVACTLLVFGSLAVRFLFPQMSLEGRRLWLIHLVPDGLRRLMAAKLWLYGLLGIMIVEGLTQLSASRLELPPPIRWWLGGVGVVTPLTLVALTLGLGAWWIDPDATDAARVVSSSNGALTLVLMLGYVALVVGALVAAWTGWVHGHPLSVALATVGLLAVSGIAGVLPVRWGLQRIERLDSLGE